MNVYTDPRLLDIHGALDVLPTLPLPFGREDSATATPTNTKPQTSPFAPDNDRPCQSESISDSLGVEEAHNSQKDSVDLRGSEEKGRSPLTTPVNGLPVVGGIGLEPTTSTMSSPPLQMATLREMRVVVTAYDILQALQRLSFTLTNCQLLSSF